VVQKQWFIFQFNLCRWLQQFVWVFDSLACIQFSVQRAFWVSREMSLWLFAYVVVTVSYVLWFLIESFFDYFWKWQLLQPVKRLQMQLLLWSQCYLCSSIVGWSSFSEFCFSWIPLTITFNLIMITILLLLCEDIRLFASPFYSIWVIPDQHAFWGGGEPCRVLF